MSAAEAPEGTEARHDFHEPSPYPSIIVNRGALPESWYPKWLFRRGRHHRRSQTS